MLNYIWLSMVLIALLVAVGNDASDEIRDPFRNGRPLSVRFMNARQADRAGKVWESDILLSSADFADFYGVKPPGSDVEQPIRISIGATRNTFSLKPSEGAPDRWKAMAAGSAEKGVLAGEVKSLVLSGGVPSAGQIVFEPIRFVKLRAVTKAALDFANTAVEIALGLIGIMALWLGLIKVAEAAGFVSLLTRVLRPLTTRLFPELPYDHPAVGAMIMNISANMLGLSNAATPMGLKAMEELNKLNTKVGTATNAMCTFLVINTSGLTLIPATAIAVRSAAGSDNPGIIIGTSLFGAACATIAGVSAVKFFQRLKRFRVPEEASHG